MTTDSNSTHTTTPTPPAASTMLLILFDVTSLVGSTPDLESLQSQIGPAIEQWLISSAASRKLPAPRLPISIQILAHSPK
jgi:hypothetical protein